MSARARRGSRPSRSTDSSIEELRQLSQKIARDIDDAIKKLDQALRQLEESMTGGGK